MQWNAFSIFNSKPDQTRTLPPPMSLNSKISKTNSTLPCSQIMHYSCIPVLQPFSLLKPRLILCLVNKLNLNLVQYHTPFRANSFLFSLVMVGLRLDIAVSVTPGTSQRKQARQHKYNTDNLHGKKKKKKKKHLGQK